MNRLTILRLLAVVLLALSAIVVEAQDNRLGKFPGLEPYMPTQLEWLALNLNARNAYRNIVYDGFAFSYSAADPDTIVLVVGYLPNVDRAKMNISVESARRAIEEQKKVYNWNWVQTKEEYKRVDK
jgi:hypothetical protein